MLFLLLLMMMVTLAHLQDLARVYVYIYSLYYYLCIFAGDRFSHTQPPGRPASSSARQAVQPLAEILGRTVESCWRRYRNLAMEQAKYAGEKQKSKNKYIRRKWQENSGVRV